MNWMKRILGWTRKKSFAETLRSEFNLLEHRFGYAYRAVLDSTEKETVADGYLSEYVNPEINRSIHIWAPRRGRENINLILYKHSRPSTVRVRDVEDYIPVKYLKAYYCPEFYNSADYIGQLVGLKHVVENFRTLILEHEQLFDGSSWIERKDFDNKLYATGKFRYRRSADSFEFVNRVREAFDFLVSEFRYHLDFSTDSLPPYSRREVESVCFSNGDKDSYITIDCDSREQRFAVKLFNYENGTNQKDEYELFNPIDLRDHEDFTFLGDVAKSLRTRITDAQGK